MGRGAFVKRCGRTTETRRPRSVRPLKRDYHFYHFSPRLPLQNATKCDDLTGIAKGPNRGKISSKLLVPKGFPGFSAGVERLSHTVEVTGSSPVTPIS